MREAPNFSAEYYEKYGELPPLSDYIKMGGIIAGITGWLLDKYPDSEVSGVFMAFAVILLPVFLIIFALPILIIVMIAGITKLQK